ncbi:hypothetical protein AAKU52_003303 [Pedobacter sp. CG_S7]
MYLKSFKRMANVFYYLAIRSNLKKEETILTLNLQELNF